MKTTANTLGASNFSNKERSENDYYGIDPAMTNALLDRETFCNSIWEPAAGHHLIVNELKKRNYNVKSTDVVDYGFYDAQYDFLSNIEKFYGDIITNPPYKYADQFVLKALEAITPGHKVAMLLRTLFLEGQSRYNSIFSKYKPKTIYVFSKRQVCSANDDFTEGSCVSYSWFVWEKGYEGETTVKWIY